MAGLNYVTFNQDHSLLAVGMGCERFGRDDTDVLKLQLEASESIPPTRSN